MLSRRVGQALPAIALLAIVLAAWQTAVSLFDIREYLLPSPRQVLAALASNEISWAAHAWITTAEIVGAFVVAGAAGVLLGIIIAWSTTLGRALMPFLV